MTAQLDLNWIVIVQWLCCPHTAFPSVAAKQGRMPLSAMCCLTHRAHNTRHLSFTSGGGAGYADGTSNSSNSPAGVAASMQAHHQQQQQRSSSSSLQVLASLQLDATLASITQEARHDGALAERLAHWKTAFREKGKACARMLVAMAELVIWVTHLW